MHLVIISFFCPFVLLSFAFCRSFVFCRGVRAERQDGAGEPRRRNGYTHTRFALSHIRSRASSPRRRDPAVASSLATENPYSKPCAILSFRSESRKGLLLKIGGGGGGNCVYNTQSIALLQVIAAMPRLFAPPSQPRTKTVKRRWRRLTTNRARDETTNFTNRHEFVLFVSIRGQTTVGTGPRGLSTNLHEFTRILTLSTNSCYSCQFVDKNCGDRPKRPLGSVPRGLLDEGSAMSNQRAVSFAKSHAPRFGALRNSFASGLLVNVIVFESNFSSSPGKRRAMQPISNASVNGAA